MREIVLIAHNLRSCHNVGSLLRVADGLGVSNVYLTGYTPYPTSEHDKRLPHLAQKITRRISKTALGAEEYVAWSHRENIDELFDQLRERSYLITALEQSKNSTALYKYEAPDKIALVVGREVEGVEPEILTNVDAILEIPMFGKKESFNVTLAASMALYYCRFNDKSLRL